MDTLISLIGAAFPMLEHTSFSGSELMVFIILAVVLATVIYLLETLLFSRRRPAQAGAELRGRLESMSVELEQLKARLETLEARPPADSGLDTRASAYSEALRLAREGASAQEVAQQLGISRGEAELLLALRRSDP